MPLGMTVILMAQEEMKEVRFRTRVQKALLNRLVESGVISKQSLERAPLPYTFSPLMPADENRGGREREAEKTTAPTPIPGGEKIRVRMTWLDDAQLHALEDWAQKQKAIPLYTDMDAEPVLLEGALVSPTRNNPWSRTVPYRQIYEEASDSLRSITLKFCSPTRLNRGGVPYPLPDPISIFKGYLHMWNDFSAIPLDPGLRTALEEELLLEDFKIRSRPFEAEKGALTCFTGSATFRLEGRHPETALKGFNTLSDYAFFCGTGTGRRDGMGLTKRIPEPVGEA